MASSRILVVALVFYVALASCETYVRVLHAFPGSGVGPAVDIYVNGALTFQNLEYKQLAPAVEYAALAAGDYVFNVTLTGTTTNIFPAVALTLADNEYRTIAAVPDVNTSIPAPFATLDNFGTVASGTAHVRAGHYASAFPSVNVQSGGQIVIPAVSFPGASEYVPVPAGTYTLTINVNSSNVQAGSFTVDLTEGWAFTAYVIDDPDNPTIAVDSRQACVNVRAGHFLPGGPAVDAEVNGLREVVDAAYQDVTDYLCAPVGVDLTVEVFVTGTNTSVVSTTFGSGSGFPAGTYATVGVVDTTAILLWAEPDPSTLSFGDGYTAFIHAAVGAQVNVDVRAGTTDVFADVAYGERAAYVGLPDGSYNNVAVFLAGTQTQVLGPLTLIVTAEQGRTVFAVGNVSETGAEALTALVADDRVFTNPPAPSASTSTTTSTSTSTSTSSTSTTSTTGTTPSPSRAPTPSGGCGISDAVCERDCITIKPSKVPKPTKIPNPSKVPAASKVPAPEYYTIEISYPCSAAPEIDCCDLYDALPSASSQFWSVCGYDSADSRVPTYDSKKAECSFYIFALAGTNGIDDAEFAAAQTSLADTFCSADPIACSVTAKDSQSLSAVYAGSASAIGASALLMMVAIIVALL